MRRQLSTPEECPATDPPSSSSRLELRINYIFDYGHTLGYSGPKHEKILMPLQMSNKSLPVSTVTIFNWL